MRRALGLLVVAILVAGCSGDDDGTDSSAGSATTTSVAEDVPEASGPIAYEGHQSEVYADPAHWLCRPDLADSVCDGDLDATVVHADGTTEVEPHEAAADPPVDCFYVYPTISADPGLSSDLVPGDEERNVVLNQAARLNSQCRVFAPVYRQVTLGALFDSPTATGDRTAAYEAAYADVADAWKHYLANDNDGRGVVLVGHSQGSGMLRQLIAEEIENDPAQVDHLVSAYLLGNTINVPIGEEVGGAFENVPVCTAADETGCVITYGSYRATDPPPPGFFGRDRGGNPEGQHAACSNPASVDDPTASAALTPYFQLERFPALTDPATNAEITTPWVTYPDFLTAACVEENGYHYLEVTVESDPADPRADDIRGDLTPGWGLHLVDANIAMGDLEALVATQAEAYAAG